VIFQRRDGFLWYAGELLTVEDGDTLREPAEVSGIYGAADAAEHAALVGITWFGEAISN
jgi:hypothetical protein